MATWGSGEPDLLEGQRTPPLKLPRLLKHLRISNFNLEHRVHVRWTGLEELEPMEAEPKDEKVVEVSVGWKWSCI